MAGTTIEISFKTLSVSVLEKALRDVLENPKYKINAEKRSRVFRDMPEKPLDRGLFWIDWMLRQKDGYSSIIPPSKTMCWFTANSYDIILTFVVLMHFAVFGIFKLVKKIKSKKNQDVNGVKKDN